MQAEVNAPIFVINNFYAQYEIKTFVYNISFVYNETNRYKL